MTTKPDVSKLKALVRSAGIDPDAPPPHRFGPLPKWVGKGAPPSHTGFEEEHEGLVAAELRRLGLSRVR